LEFKAKFNFITIAAMLMFSILCPAEQREVKHPLACRVALSLLAKYNNLKEKFKGYEYKGPDRKAFDLEVYGLLRTKFEIMIDEYQTAVNAYTKEKLQEFIEKNIADRPLSGLIPIEAIRQIIEYSGPYTYGASGMNVGPLPPDVMGYMYEISGVPNKSYHQGFFKLSPEIEIRWKQALEPLDSVTRAVIVKSLQGMVNNMVKNKQYNFDLATGYYSDFIEASPKAWEQTPIEFERVLLFHQIVTPVGAYGSSFTEALIRTTQVLFNIAYENLGEASEVIYKDDPDLIGFETARGRDNHRITHTDTTAPLASFIEGILSIHQAIALLTASRIEGAETGAKAIDVIANSTQSGSIGLVSELTRRLPMGIIGPLTLRAQYFPNPILKTEKGYVLNSNIKEALKQFRKEFDTRFVKNYKRSKGPLGLSCPVAACAGEDGSSDTGIQKIVVLYQTVFHQVEKEIEQNRVH
jgi:hypothetical protein